MLYNANNQPNKSFIQRILNIFYYSTGFPCGFALIHKNNLVLSSQIAVPAPLEWLKEDETYYGSIITDLITTQRFNTSIVIQLHHQKKGLLCLLSHKKIIHGAFFTQISDAQQLQISSLQNLFDLCINNNKLPPSEKHHPPLSAITNKFTETSSIQHHPYHLEKKIMVAQLINNDTDTSALDDYILPLLSKDPFRSEKNLRIINISLIARTVLSFGLDVNTSFSLSDHYINLIDAAVTFDEVAVHFQHALSEYRQRIGGLEHIYSPVIDDLLVFVEQNITVKIRLDDFIKESSYSYAYVSTLFHKEVGLNFNTYVHTKKIEQACKSLRNTAYSIQDISEQFGYSYPYLFTEMFKKIVGMTPSQYRKLIMTHSSNNTYGIEL